MKDQANALSVVIATLDRPEALKRCLDALFTGAMLPGEVVIVDQGRQASAWPVVEAYQKVFSPLIYIHQDRRGLSTSRNTGIAQASGPRIAITDDDCVPAPGWVAALDRTFAFPSAPDAVTGRVLPLGPTAPGLYAASSRPSTTQREFRGKMIPTQIGTGGNFAAKREWFLRVGGYDERLGAGSSGKAGEDIDIIYKFLLAGACIRYEPDALVYHERKSRAQHHATRWTYGMGIGAFCSLWLRSGDLFALRILSYWLRLQGGGLWGAIKDRDWPQVGDKQLMLRGTVSGLLYGFRLHPARPLSSYVLYTNPADEQVHGC